MRERERDYAHRLWAWVRGTVSTASLVAEPSFRPTMKCGLGGAGEMAEAITRPPTRVT